MQLGFVEVSGKDAAEFLHRVTAGTVKGLGEAQGRAGLLLSGQSRMIAQFDLLKVNASKFLLAVPKISMDSLFTSLEALHFAEDLNIQITDLQAGVVRAKEGERSEPFLVDINELSWPSPIPGFRFSAEGTENAEGFEFARIHALVPRPPLDWDPNTPALEAGVLPWIDRFKGCYPGQEVVELSLNVGHPARVMIAVGTPELLKAGIDSKIKWDTMEAQVTSAATLGGKHCALVRVPWAKKDFLPSGFVRLKSHW